MSAVSVYVHRCQRLVLESQQNYEVNLYIEMELLYTPHERLKSLKVLNAGEHELTVLVPQSVTPLSYGEGDAISTGSRFLPWRKVDEYSFGCGRQLCCCEYNSEHLSVTEDVVCFGQIEGLLISPNCTGSSLVLQCTNKGSVVLQSLEESVAHRFLEKRCPPWTGVPYVEFSLLPLTSSSFVSSALLRLETGLAY